MVDYTDIATIPEPAKTLDSLYEVVSALKQTVEALVGQRGGDGSTVVTVQDLADAANLAGVDPDVALDNLGFDPDDYLEIANNLSDLASAGTARTNLGLGTLATKSVVTFAERDVLYKAMLASASGQNVTTAQPWFPTAGAVTVASGTAYFMEGLILVTSGATSHSFRLAFGGTATLTRIDYSAYHHGETVIGNSGNIDGVRVTTAAETIIIALDTNEEHVVRIRGIVQINSGGTFIPQFHFGTAPGTPVDIQPGTFFRLTPLIGASQGTWA